MALIPIPTAASRTARPEVSVPERGFVVLILPSGEEKARCRRSRFSPRAGIRGFDTSGRGYRVGAAAAEVVSVPERGFVALIRDR